MMKRNRITVTWELMKTSLQLLLADKRILWAPIIAVLVSLVLGGVFAVPIIFDLVHWAAQNQMHNTPVGLVVMFIVYYVLLYFISTFAGAMVISHIHRQLSGQVTSLGLAFQDAWQRVGALFLWSVLAASIGMLIHNLERSHRSIAAIIAGLFVGLAWGMISFLPCLLL